MTKLDQLGQIANVDTAQLRNKLQERVNDVAGLLARHTAQARQMLKRLLIDKIELTPVGAGRKRGYQFRGALTIDRLIGGEALQTSLTVVAPTGYHRRWLAPLTDADQFASSPLEAPGCR